MIGKWSQEEMNLLKQMMDSGRTNKQIAWDMRRSLRSVEQKIVRLGIQRATERVPNEVFRQLWERHKQGATIRALANETGYSKWRLCSRWRDMGLTKPHGVSLTIRQKRLLYARHMAGERVVDLAREVGMNPRALRETWRRSKCGYARRERPNVEPSKTIAAIKARADGVKWDDVPAHIGSSKSVNAIRLAVWHYKKKSGS